jgi:hypothetical protein
MLLEYQRSSTEGWVGSSVCVNVFTMTKTGRCWEVLQVVVRSALLAVRAGSPRAVNGSMTSSHKLIASGARHVFIYGDRYAGHRRARRRQGSSSSAGGAIGSSGQRRRIRPEPTLQLGPRRPRLTLLPHHPVAAPGRSSRNLR